MSRCLVIVLALATAVACKSKEPASSSAKATATESLPAAAAPKPGVPVKPGELRRKSVHVGFGVIVPKGGDPGKVAGIAKERGALDVTTESIASLRLDRELLSMLARNTLSEADIDGVLGAAGVVFLAFTGEDAKDVVRKSATLTAELAGSVQGWVMDGDAQRFITTLEFRKAASSTDVRDHIVVKTIGDEGELPFLLTGGMRKFGVPELYLRVLPRSRAQAITSVINATAQALVDGTDVAREGVLEFQLPADERGQGPGKVSWRVAWVQEPDGEEQAIELIPPGGATTEALEAMLTDVWGGEAKGNVSEFSDNDPEMLAAYAKARTELASKRAYFAKGVPLRERLAVKAPFAYRDGADESSEWMWVDVVRWHGDTLEGTLANEPIYVKGIRAGSAVKVKLESIGDYIHETADGKQLGGHTIEVARKRGLIP